MSSVQCPGVWHWWQKEGTFEGWDVYKIVLAVVLTSLEASWVYACHVGGLMGLCMTILT